MYERERLDVPQAGRYYPGHSLMANPGATSILMFAVIENHPAFVVIYKYPDVSFHREGDNPGLFETVKAQLNLAELYPVHRLDKVTSGLLVMAKTAAANAELSAQFAERKIEKFYLAIADKKPQKKQGLVKGDMAPARRGAWKLLPSQENPALTQFFSKSLSAGKRLFIIKPRTGKTHQIRVALKSLGAPIRGDALYGDSAAAAQVDRTYLHAYQLAFSLAGSAYRFQAAPREGSDFTSPDFLTALGDFAAPQDLPWPAP